MRDSWTDRLSEFVDGDLPEAGQMLCEQHLAECLECRIAADELRAVRTSARALRSRQPARDLWPGIEARLERPSHRRISFSWPAAIAAGLFIAVASGLGTWVLLQEPSANGVLTVQTTPAQMRSIALNSAPYDRAIADLLTTLRTERRDLSPRTIETIERSLTAIDKAIADAQAALERDPTDVELVSYLTDRQRARLAVLRQVERFSPDDQ